MGEKPIIKRYFEMDEGKWTKTKKDLGELIKLINSSEGEYSFQLRENYFNIYYQGNSLAKAMLNKNGTYSVEIHEEFAKEDGSIFEKLERHSQSVRKSGKYMRFTVHPANLRRFFQRNNLDSLSSKIRGVHSGEEIVFEQALITDNPPSSKFIIIDRQVADHVSPAQMDLLALRRDSEDKPFHFQIIEVKLGRNKELFEDVGEQLNSYVERVRKYITAYARCYETNYRQKKELGLFNPFDPNLPDQIEIERDATTVEGLVIVCGYSKLGEKAIKNLKEKIEEKGWNIRVHQITNKLVF